MESLQQAENIRIPVRLTPEELKEKELQYMVSKANNDIKADGLENIPDVVVVPVWLNLLLSKSNSLISQNWTKSIFRSTPFMIFHSNSILILDSWDINFDNQEK